MKNIQWCHNHIKVEKNLMPLSSRNVPYWHKLSSLIQITGLNCIILYLMNFMKQVFTSVKTGLMEKMYCQQSLEISPDLSF